MANFYISDNHVGGPPQSLTAADGRHLFPGENMRNLPESALNELRDHVLLMGGEVENAIDHATRALIERDTDLAEQVLRDDDRVDALELEADRLCVQLLSIHSSEASDLRLVVTAIKITPFPRGCARMRRHAS